MCLSDLKRYSSQDIYHRENGFFFLKFGSKDECDRTLHEGPWLFDGRLIILKRWNESTALEKDILSSIRVWVRFPSLHLKFCSQRILSKEPNRKTSLYDNATATVERIAYARYFVETSSSRELPDMITIELGGERIKILVEYEWTPPLRKKCSSFGHIDAQCPSTLVWRAKEKDTQVAKEGRYGVKKQMETTGVVGASATETGLQTPAYQPNMEGTPGKLTHTMNLKEGRQGYTLLQMLTCQMQGLRAS